MNIWDGMLDGDEATRALAALSRALNEANEVNGKREYGRDRSEYGRDRSEYGRRASEYKKRSNN